jgi:probable phosphomutase (TIGR03848 family)
MSTVLLIRHGRTSANARGVLAGRTEGVGLDGPGRRQARSLAARLRQVPLAAAVHSPLLRCAQTLDAILAVRAEPVARHADPRLVECDYGRWTGRPLRELADDPLWRDVQTAPSTVVFPDGEAMAAMAERAVSAVADWRARQPDGVVAMVTHGDVIKAILSDALGQSFDAFQRIAVAPGSLSVVAYTPDGPRVLRVNDTGSRLRVGPAAVRPTVGGGAG